MCTVRVCEALRNETLLIGLGQHHPQPVFLALLWNLEDHVALLDTQLVAHQSGVVEENNVPWASVAWEDVRAVGDGVLPVSTS